MQTFSLPPVLGFKNHGLNNFDPVLSLFDWSIRDTNILIDMRNCRQANYQALALLVPYVWHLRMNNCNVDFRSDPREGASRMWLYMGPGAGHMFSMSLRRILRATNLSR